MPAEINRTELLGPLSVRTTNALVRGGFLHLTGHVSVDDLLGIANFGTTSLLELMCVAEAAGIAAVAPDKPPDAREEMRQDAQLEPVSSVPKKVFGS